MAAAEPIEVEIVYARPERQRGISLKVAGGTCVADAIRQSGILAECPDAIREVSTADGLGPSHQGLHWPGNRPNKQQRNTNNREDKYGDQEENHTNDIGRFLVRLHSGSE